MAINMRFDIQYVGVDWGSGLRMSPEPIQVSVEAPTIDEAARAAFVALFGRLPGDVGVYPDLEVDHWKDSVPVYVVDKESPRHGSVRQVFELRVSAVFAGHPMPAYNRERAGLVAHTQYGVVYKWLPVTDATRKEVPRG